MEESEVYMLGAYVYFVFFKRNETLQENAKIAFINLHRLKNQLK